VLRKVAQLRSLLESYNRIRNTATDPATSPELANTKSDLESLLSELADLEDLEDSVTAVESNPSHFNLTTEQVRRRRGFVDQIKDQIDDLKAAANSAYDESQVWNT
jgi:recombinational DNA repair ATPase RecF